ncbi:hypothetical protein Cfor_05433 [Coptotermes formosanus]|uniref:Cuticle protein n=1 Tax=Coptotermes formosanus TaxID=36987 RepID=A0A6L2Q2J9_COPFO|nr:hypothetical protein Cfor_05433 [Coptotermes formosanus]
MVMLAVIVCIWATDPKELEEPDAPVGPPQPYSFSYTAGRYPGHVDRTHSETSDGTGTIRGMFAYVDPRYQVRTVEYVADAQGFHPVLSNPVADTPTVAAAKVRHADLYARIAAEHARIAAERGPEQRDDTHHLNY